MLIGVLAESPANTYSSHDNITYEKRSKVKLKLEISEFPGDSSNSSSYVTVVNCYDIPAEYAIKNLKKGDIIYVEGLLKPATEWNSKYGVLPIGRFLKKLSLKDSDYTAQVFNSKHSKD